MEYWWLSTMIQNVPAAMGVVLVVLFLHRVRQFFISVRRTEPEQFSSQDSVSAANAPDSFVGRDGHLYVRRNAWDQQYARVIRIDEQEMELARQLHAGRGPTALGTAHADEIMRKYPAKPSAPVKSGKCVYCGQGLVDGECVNCGGPQPEKA